MEIFLKSLIYYYSFLGKVTDSKLYGLLDGIIIIIIH